MRTRHNIIGGAEGHCATHGWLPLDRAHFAWSDRRGEFVGNTCRDCRRAYQAAYRASNGAGTTRVSRAMGRKFGIEVEFIGNRYDVEREIRAAFVGTTWTVAQGNYTTKASGHNFIVAPDGSVNGGGEVKTPPLRGAAGRDAIERLGRALAAAGATVNKSCGLHVHHDMRGYTLDAFRTLVFNWNDAQAFIDLLVAPSRRNGRNTYCQPFDGRDLQRVTNLRELTRSAARYGLSGERYRNLNFQSYAKHGTVEVRQHQGTTDATKMLSWVAFGQAMMTAAAAGHRMDDVADLTDLLTRLVTHGGLDQETADRLFRRSVALNRTRVSA